MSRSAMVGLLGGYDDYRFQAEQKVLEAKSCVQQQ
jgi:hypothetical protein